MAILADRREQGFLELEPSLFLARLLVQKQREAEALHLLREVARRWPDASRAHFFLGDLLAATGDLTGGEPFLRRAVELAPNEANFLVALLRLLTIRHQGALTPARPDSAAQAVRDELSHLAMRASALLSPEETSQRMILGFTYRALVDFPRAQDEFRLAARNPNHRKEALLQLAICQDEAGETDLATKTLEKLWEEYPGDPVVANSLGYLLAEQKTDLERAEALIRQALAVDPENGAYIDSLGWVFFQQGNFSKAFDQLVRAANALPDDGTILEHLGLTLRALGQTDEALRVLRRAIAVGADPDKWTEVIQELEAIQEQQ
jgi:Flp pilus assembly protein TadD